MTFDPRDLDALRWYETRANHGRGRVCAETNRLMRAGLLRLTWTGPKTWCISITAKGQQALADNPLRAQGLAS